MKNLKKSSRAVKISASMQYCGDVVIVPRLFWISFFLLVKVTEVQMLCDLKYSEHNSHCLVNIIDGLLCLRNSGESCSTLLLCKKGMDSPFKVWGIYFAWV